MTHEELMALPEWFAFDEATRVIDGKTYRVRVLRERGAQWFEADEPIQAIDSAGVVWRFVKSGGVLYRERS